MRCIVAFGGDRLLSENAWRDTEEDGFKVAWPDTMEFTEVLPRFNAAQELVASNLAVS